MRGCPENSDKSVVGKKLFKLCKLSSKSCADAIVFIVFIVFPLVVVEVEPLLSWGDKRKPGDAPSSATPWHF